MSKVTVIGYKHFNGEIDSSHIQSLKIMVVLPVEETENQSGKAGVEYKARYGLHETIKKYHGKFPVDLDIEISQMAASGGRINLVVTEIKPINQPPRA
jgi:hypothetical protein